jgi:hypothetical protein
MRGGSPKFPFAAPTMRWKIFKIGAGSLSHRHAPRKVARLACGDPQQMLGLLCLKDHFFAGGEDHLTAEHRGSRRSSKIWIFRPIAWTAA